VVDGFDAAVSWIALRSIRIFRHCNKTDLENVPKTAILHWKNVPKTAILHWKNVPKTAILYWKNVPKIAEIYLKNAW